MSRARAILPPAWGAAAFLIVALAARGPGISRQEARVLAQAGAAPSTAGEVEVRPPLPALLARAGEAAAAGVGLPHLLGYRLASALAAGLLAALLALLALELAGPLVAALAPALLLSAPRLLLPLAQAGPAAASGALALAVLLAYRRAAREPRPPARLGYALAAGALFGLALAAQLEAAALLAALAAHAAFLAVRRLLRGRAAGQDGGDAGAPLHARGALAALAAMALVGPAVALALWPALWADPLHRLQAALAAVPGHTPVLFLGHLLESPHPPWGYPLMVSALALPAALVAAMAGGVALALARAVRRGAAEPAAEAAADATRADALLLLLAAAAPLAAAQAGLAALAPGPAPWFAAFPPLALLAAQAIVAAASTVVPARARTAAAVLAMVTLSPGVLASARAYPDLGAAWGELAGGAPGAASLGLPRHDGEAVAALLDEVSARAPRGARIHWTSLPPAALAVYAADGRIRADLVAAASLEEADVAVLPLAGRPRQDEYQVWAALRTTSPVAGAYLDEVPLAWVYARPGAWR